MNIMRLRYVEPKDSVEEDWLWRESGRPIFCPPPFSLLTSPHLFLLSIFLPSSIHQSYLLGPTKTIRAREVCCIDSTAWDVGNNTRLETGGGSWRAGGGGAQEEVVVGD